ncbi:MAG: hypothetical protein J6D33_09250 [Turicibacter sp.]|nr:hypothetical protein [Turicibacter sp.]
MKKIITALLMTHGIGAFGFVVGADSAPSTLIVDSNSSTTQVSETLYGLFYEDINFAADGGIYAEQVFNRSFEYTSILSQNSFDGMTGWRVDLADSKKGKVGLDQTYPLNEKNPTSLKVEVLESGFMIRNVGHTMNVTKSTAEMSIFNEESYDLSFYIRNSSYEGELRFYLEDQDGMMISTDASTKVKSSDEWIQMKNLSLKGLQTTGGRLVIEANGVGAFYLDMVSLMPKDYYGANNSEWKYGGLRSDLVEALKDLNPQFLRFPGGCVAEGAYDQDNHYNWKDTIGPIESRKENANLWGYMQSYGLGYHEYFQLAEDLGATPIPVVHAGILCQVRSGDLQPMLPSTDDFKQLTQDILDLIEYANGDTSTEWGAKRAENGHKESFNLTYIAIGNENWGERYFKNFKVLKAAVEEVYPDMTIITTSGTLSEGSGYDYAWDTIQKQFLDTYVDEHYYNSPEWFLNNTDRYETYRRDSAKVFVGEFAAHADFSGGVRPNTLYTALCEGAYLTGIERNSDVVKMISYAPLLARTNAYQWTPDMIWFDSHEVMLTPNYYVFQLFSNHIGTKYLNTELVTSENLYHSVTVDEETEEIYIKIVNPSEEETSLTIDLQNFERLLDQAELTIIAHEEANAQNSMDDKNNVSPKTSVIEVVDETVTVDIVKNSATLIHLGYGKTDFVAGDSSAKTQDSSKEMVAGLIMSGIVIVGTLSTHLILKRRGK